MHQSCSSTVHLQYQFQCTNAAPGSSPTDLSREENFIQQLLRHVYEYFHQTCYTLLLFPFYICHFITIIGIITDRILSRPNPKVFLVIAGA